MLITKEIEGQGDDAGHPEADEDGGQSAPVLHSWLVRLGTGMMIFVKYPAGLMLTLGSAACYLDGSPPPVGCRRLSPGARPVMQGMG
jgi:hypothetical protein